MKYYNGQWFNFNHMIISNRYVPSWSFDSWLDRKQFFLNFTVKIYSKHVNNNY